MNDNSQLAGQVQAVIDTQVEQVRDALLALPGWERLKEAPASGGTSGRPVDRRARDLQMLCDPRGRTAQTAQPGRHGNRSPGRLSGDGRHLLPAQG
jgi:hypothetical protein